MTIQDTRTSLFINTFMLIGNIAERSLKLAAIDALFEVHGADPGWRTKAEVGGFFESRKGNRAYGWMVGVEKFAPDKTFIVARDVLWTLVNSGTIVSADDRRLAIRMIDRIERYSGWPTSIPSKQQLDPRVNDAAGALYASRHYAEAVRAAFAALVIGVKDKAERPDLDGAPLMTQAFRPSDPILRLSNVQDEQQGWMELFKGSVAVIRNPLSHGSGSNIEAEEANELLAFASFLFRRLDRATKVRH